MNDFLYHLKRRLRVLKRQGLIVWVGIDYKWSDGVEYGGRGPYHFVQNFEESKQTRSR